MNKILHLCSCKVHDFLSDFNGTLFVLKDFFLNTYQISWKFPQWSRVVPCGWTDGHTDRDDKANCRFS